MMNLLIAIMGDSYAKVKENERVEAWVERVKMIMDMEADLGAHHVYPKFLHIAVEQRHEEEDDDTHVTNGNWEGTTGRVKFYLNQERKLTDAKIEAQTELLHVKLDAQTGALEGKLVAVTTQMTAVQQQLARVEALLQSST